MKPFELYYDPQDMTTCVKADTTVREMNEIAAADKLYFPLFLSEEMPVGELVLGYRFTSRSYRFGPLCDNVLGFNFVFPDGKQVKVGAQVVKNVTGFDFARFLTNSGYRFGTVERVVLRLRAMADSFQYRRVSGKLDAMETFRRELLGSATPPPKKEGAHGGPVRHSRASRRAAYGQVLDAFDFVVEQEGLQFQLSFSCDEDQVQFYDQSIGELAQRNDCAYENLEGLDLPSPQPFVRVKTLMSAATMQAADLVSKLGGRAHGFVGNAFFPWDPADGEALDGKQLGVLERLHRDVAKQGGHLRCEKLEYPDSVELRWEQALKEKWEALP